MSILCFIHYEPISKHKTYILCMRYIQKITSIFIVIAYIALSIPSFASAAEVSSSSNWSGYIAQNGTGYTSINGTWVVPAVTATSSFSGDATWVGIGGVSTSDLIQAGTQALIENGQVTYEAWIETLPQTSQDIPITIHAGDSVHVSISLENQSTNDWLLSFTDNTTEQTYQTNLTYTSSESSAEWIEEMPSITIDNISARDFSLDSFGTVNFTNCTTTQNGMSYTLTQAGAYPVTMLNSQDQALATPSALGSDNESFGVTRSEAVSNTSNPYQYASSPSTTQPSGAGYRIGRSNRAGIGIRGFTPGTSSLQGKWGYQKITKRRFGFDTQMSFSFRNTTYRFFR